MWITILTTKIPNRLTRQVHKRKTLKEILEERKERRRIKTRRERRI